MPGSCQHIFDLVHQLARQQRRLSSPRPVMHPGPAGATTDRTEDV